MINFMLGPKLDDTVKGKKPMHIFLFRFTRMLSSFSFFLFFLFSFGLLRSTHVLLLAIWDRLNCLVLAALHDPGRKGHFGKGSF